MTPTIRRPAARPSARPSTPAARRRPLRPVRRHPGTAHRAAVYRRRRALAGVVVAAAVGATALVADGVLTGAGGDPASAAGTGAAGPTHGRVVRVRAGDSLWSIAVEHHGTAPLMPYVEELIERNRGTVVVVGQLLHLP